jgi:hypothetical protein
MALYIVVAWAPIDAQTLRGVVVDDSSKAPLRDAVVTLLDIRGAETGMPSARSDSLGRFTIHAGQPGRYRARVTRIGYQPLTSDDINLAIGGTVTRLTLGMAGVATRLGTVVVGATTRLSRDELLSYVGFDLRKTRGVGKFMDSLDLARLKRQPIGHALTEDLRLQFGTEIFEDRDGREVVTLMTSDLMICQPEVWIDGFEVHPDRAITRLRSFGADEVYGLEVYGANQLPPASIGGLIGSTQAVGSWVTEGMLQGRAVAARRPPGMRRGPWTWSRRPCGAIALWTKVWAQALKAGAEKRIPPAAGHTQVSSRRILSIPRRSIN